MPDLAITPKNWGEFQHYKERNPPWIKLHYNLLDNPDFIGLPIASKALAPCIWLLASRYPEGVIRLSAQKLSLRLRITEREFWSAFKPLIVEGFFSCEQNASNALATRSQSALTETETETETEKETENKCIVALACDHTQSKLDFDDFWKAYPKRCGTNSKAKALEKFTIIVKNGIDPATIIAGAERYAEHCIIERKTNTEFVQQTTTWLNQKGWETDYGKRINGIDLALERIDRAIRTAESGEERGPENPMLLPER